MLSLMRTLYMPSKFHFIESYPWWPAVVFDPDHSDVPDEILVQFKETRSRRKMKLYIVRFYDRGSTWAYLGREKLKMLGEDDSTCFQTHFPTVTVLGLRGSRTGYRYDFKPLYQPEVEESENTD